MTHSAPSAAPTTIVIRETRSVGLALLLTFFFGPLGMLYSTVSGALIMIVVSVVLGVFTLGLGLLLTWPICMIWGAMAASAHNTRVLAGVR